MASEPRHGTTGLQNSQAEWDSEELWAEVR